MMANPHILTSVIPPESSEKRETNIATSNMNAPLPLNLQGQASSDGPLAILWDIENCPVPSDVHPEDAAGNIRMALRVHPVIRGAVMMFSAYGDFNAFPKRLREGCQRTGVKLIDVPNGRKDAADKAILVDMFLFALDNPPPSSIMLISGDVDFAPALHILGQRGYTVILVIPSGTGVSSALYGAGKFVWDWSSVARGEGFLPPSKALMASHRMPSEHSSYFKEGHINDNPHGHNEEEAILYRGNSQSYHSSRDISMVVQAVSGCWDSTYSPFASFPTTLGSQSLPFWLNEVPGRTMPFGIQNECAMWVQPGDINGLKGQLVKLLELFGGSMPLTSVPAEYLKIFGRPLYISEFGATKLVNLFKKMSDMIAVHGKGKKKSVHLQNWKAAPTAPPLILTRKDKKGKRIQGDHFNVFANNGSSDEFSDEERMVVQEHDNRCQGKADAGIRAQSVIDDNILEQFKYELQEILVSYACRISLTCFEEIYQQRYKKQLDYRKLGASHLVDLFDKVRDVIVVKEDPVSKKKFLSAEVARR